MTKKDGWDPPPAWRRCSGELAADRLKWVLDVEDDDDDGSLGLGPSTIHIGNDRAGGATRSGNDGIGRVTAATTS